MIRYMLHRRAFTRALSASFLAAASLSAASISTAMAGQVALDGEPLSAGEIETLLSGNTISGDWGGLYKQYYDPDGSTAYVPDGGEVGIGKWRVNAETDEYESWWESTGWTPYRVGGSDGHYYWIDKKGDKYPFTVLEGKQVDWKAGRGAAETSDGGAM